MRGFYFKRAAPLTLGLLASLVGCTRYIVPITDAEPPSPLPIVYVPQSLMDARQTVLDYVRGRNRLETTFILPKALNEIRVTQRWVRDTSLRYYSLFFDTRSRHIVEWKGQWILKAVSPGTTEIQLKILEVLYFGRAKDAGLVPAPAAGWYEAPVDSLRASLELRRFWIENYPTEPLPPVLANLNVPLLDGPPLSKVSETPHWPMLRRPRSF